MARRSGGYALYELPNGRVNVDWILRSMKAHGMEYASLGETKRSNREDKKYRNGNRFDSGVDAIIIASIASFYNSLKFF